MQVYTSNELLDNKVLLKVKSDHDKLIELEKRIEELEASLYFLSKITVDTNK